MIIKIKRLHPNAVIPKYANPGDAGLDITAISCEWDAKHEVMVYGTGLSFEIPKGHVGLLFPRSSIYKQKISLSNAVGVIDSSYRGEIMFKFRAYDDTMNHYLVGDRIGQLIILPYPSIQFEEVEELSETERGANGYGSTGS